MAMHDSGIYRLWSLTGEADDYFRRLGGAGCYSGYADWHPPALVILLLCGADPTKDDFMRSREACLLPRAMWESTDELPKLMQSRLKNFKLDSRTLDEYLRKITKNICEHNRIDDLLGWSKFLTESKFLMRNVLSL